jgi:uncharacterized protein (TIRG00374 family)
MTGNSAQQGPSQGRHRLILLVLRYGLCAAAIVWLVMTVPWHDHVRLNDARRTRVRLIAQRGGEFVVEQDGREQVLAAEQVHWIRAAGRSVPDIEYGIRSVVRNSDKLKALWAVLLFAPVPLLAAVRLVWMLRIADVGISWWNSVILTFAGNFFNFALPGMTGGDVVKAYYITRLTTRKTEAVTTVLLDRVIGLTSFVAMAAIMILLTRNPAEFADLALMLAAILLGLAALAVVVFSRRIRRRLHLREILQRLPMASQLERVAQATLAMRQRKLLVGLALLITFLLQSIVIVSAIVMADALRMQVRFGFFFIYIAIGFVIAAIPITPPQAIGIMEFFYVQVFTSGGENSASQALALAVAVRLIQLVWALPGILVPLTGGPRPQSAELRATSQAAAEGTDGALTPEVSKTVLKP